MFEWGVIVVLSVVVVVLMFKLSNSRSIMEKQRKLLIECDHDYRKLKKKFRWK